MVIEGIVLGHKISSNVTDVDKAKIEVIEQMLWPINVKGIICSLEHARFYRLFIKEFSKISNFLCDLLAKDVPFEFTKCLVALDRLKYEFIYVLIIASPD